MEGESGDRGEGGGGVCVSEVEVWWCVRCGEGRRFDEKVTERGLQSGAAV